MFAHAAPSEGAPFASLKLALVSDDLTRVALERECQVRNVTPRNAARLFKRWKPDLLFVESAWNGYRDTWRYKIASYPDHPRRNNRTLAKAVAIARDLGIPAVFWNREDGVHFARFIESASLFDRVLTVDNTMIPAYRETLGPGARIGTMMFAASKSLHYPTWEDPQKRAAFVGSYSTHIHDKRREWQDMMFDAIHPLGLTAFDRNSKRRPEVYRFPDRPWIDIRPAVPNHVTPAIFRRHIVNLNVNTITGSQTAFSRRLVEVLACGGFIVSNETEAVRAQFDGLCVTIDDAEYAEHFFKRIAMSGLTKSEQEMRRAAHEHVVQHHSWESRIADLLQMAE